MKNNYALLNKELSDLKEKIYNSEFIDPKDFRRKEELENIIYGDFKIKKGREYKKGLRAKNSKTYGTGGKNK